MTTGIDALIQETFGDTEFVTVTEQRQILREQIRRHQANAIGSAADLTALPIAPELAKVRKDLTDTLRAVRAAIARLRELDADLAAREATLAGDVPA